MTRKSFTALLMAAAIFAGKQDVSCRKAVAAELEAPPSYEEARQASWLLTGELIKILEHDDAKWPCTQAWLKDLREQTKGIDKDVPVAEWPKVDVGALVDHNPNFWRMYYETAPGDPILTVIHAGVLLSQGEAMRAVYIIDLGQHRPGIPQAAIQALHGLQHTAMAAIQDSNAVTAEGTRLFDQGDYDAAIQKYREAHRLCPTNGWTYYEMGYTLRTKAKVARGEKPGKQGTVQINGKSQDTPEVTAAFAGPCGAEGRLATLTILTNSPTPASRKNLRWANQLAADGTA